MWSIKQNHTCPLKAHYLWSGGNPELTIMNINSRLKGDDGVVGRNILIG